MTAPNLSGPSLAQSMTTRQCLDTINRVLVSLEPGHSFRESLQELLRALAENLHFDRPHIMVQDPESGMLRLSLSLGPAEAPDSVYAPGTGITGRVFATGTPCIVPCMTDQADFRNRLFGRSREEMEHLAFLCVPVRINQSSPESQIVGTLSADTPAAQPEELELRCLFLETVASLIGRQVAWLQEDLVRQHFQVLTRDGPVPHFSGIIALSKSMRGVLRQVGQVAPSRATVLLRGESGVGKELMAQAVHEASPRKDMPLVRLNCAALPAELVEGELFGWKKGAFTGAVQDRRGLFQQANGGTLFLDEIGDLSTNAQAKVLRALQEGEVQPLGASHVVNVDVRLVCATNRPLEKLVEQQAFRADLYYRINVFPIFIPPLRERTEDIIPLAEHYLQMFGSEYTRPVKRISPPAVDLLLHYNWPGNIRELKNVMERAVLVCDEDTIRAYHLPASLQGNAQDTPEAHRSSEGFAEAIARLEKRYIVDALHASHGNIHQAARSLGITYRIIYYKMKKYGIDFHKFLDKDAGPDNQEKQS